MIFLITKILVYLLLAAGIGGAAGWLLRNLQAQRTQDNASRSVHEAKAKLPQLESLLRGRDDQIAKLKMELKQMRSGAKDLDGEMRNVEMARRELELETARLREQLAARSSNTLDDVETDANDLITSLSEEIVDLKAQLANPPVALAPVGGDPDLLQAQLDAMQLQLTRAESSAAETARDLEAAQQRLQEMESERELQNRSLQVLHQQLELERTRRAS